MRSRGWSGFRILCWGALCSCVSVAMQHNAFSEGQTSWTSKKGSWSTTWMYEHGIFFNEPNSEFHEEPVRENIWTLALEYVALRNLTFYGNWGYSPSGRT